MQIRVGITTSDLTRLEHARVVVEAPHTGQVELTDQSGKKSILPLRAPVTLIAAGEAMTVSGEKVQQGKFVGALFRSQAGPLRITSLMRANGPQRAQPDYRGSIEVFASQGKLRVILITDLETYLEGVLGAEMPASYAGEALKAQAVTARTYALRPRISHDADGCAVCDSYLCCQYFAGAGRVSEAHLRAIHSTRGRVLTYGGGPLLALFSSCAGGHTESYENCFSDPLTGAFPPAPIAYLQGRPEGRLPKGFPSEESLRQVWQGAGAETSDSWSPQFRWSVRLTADQLEGHMHHVIETMLADPQLAPFITPPPSGRFGHLEKFAVDRRGVSGMAISLKIHTSKGIWTVRKELVIRSAFANPDLKLARLKSARIFFNHRFDGLGLLSQLEIGGLGFGHGVGLQQTGAQGHARRGLDYRAILTHYYPGAAVEEL